MAKASLGIRNVSQSVQSMLKERAAGMRLGSGLKSKNPNEQKTKQDESIGTAKVLANALNVRSGAGQNFPRIGGLKKGKTVTVYEEKDNWLKIGYGAGYGWVMKQYTDYVSPTPSVDPENPSVTEPEEPAFKSFQVSVTADVGLNMRDIPGNGTQPASGSKIYDCIPYGTILTVTAEKNGWYQVEYNGKTGWVCATWTVDYDPNVKPPQTTDNGVVVDVKLKPQQTNYTCGSASGAMCATTYSGKDVSESDIWNNCDDGYETYVYAITNSINYNLKKKGKSGDYKYKQTTSDDKFYEGVKTSLSMNAPVECQLKPSTLAAFGYKSSGHYVVASGAFEKNGVKMLRITDPFSGSWTKAAPKGQIFDAPVSDIRSSIKSHSNYVMLHSSASV